jgi:hypothetical protein
MEGRESLRKNARNEEKGRISETNVLPHKVCRSAIVFTAITVFKKPVNAKNENMRIS